MEDVHIVKREIKLPNEEDSGKTAFILDNVYTESECKTLIEKSEEKGYEQALINIGANRQVLDTEYRNSQRILWDNEDLARDLTERIRKFLPEEYGGGKLQGVNERLRFLKYVPGNFFKCHRDGYFARDGEDGTYEKTLYTVMLYLNTDYKGGRTTFVSMKNLTSGDRVDVMPGDVQCDIKPGSVLIFQHNILHEGSLLHEGTKYCVRSDILYKFTK